MIQLSSRTIHTIKLLFNVGFITVIIFRLVKRAFDLLPDDALFFMTSDAVENFMSVLIAYMLYYYVFRLKRIWQKVVCITFFMIMLIGLAILKDIRIHDDVSANATFEYFTSFLGQTLLFYLLLHFVNKLDVFNYYKKIENELYTAREQLLRNQLHPHFLFNALNSLYSLSLKNSTETPEYILKLSSMMRYITDQTHLAKVPISMELDFIKKYITLEKMRFGNDAAIHMAIEGTITDEKLIEPLLLIPLVENAFKHGFYTNANDAFVKVEVNIANDHLIFSVKNNVPVKQHFQESKRIGKGLDNLKKRLQLLYPKDSTLDINTTENTYAIQLNIHLN
ncbi:hypothetical protein GCM10011344_11330 [Dokdonia pacifica]|uniref:Histidine kinase n=1 Tax=Dokdonia pacifica TaxID=1627892 RepID=A0A238YHE3_9FLAO|nr:histidine kinase [Dokdonia pacifica]GGG12378.1 hypothetical protein GCM10011344_11330 [Dokdonia pacifica]SNR70392.1 Histidine kinase [Dokdonia pacifica]